MSTLTLVAAGLAWLGLLFAVALFGERSQARWQKLWPVVYSLSLAVYCTAWTFYGTTTQAAQSGWPIPPTFVGTIVLFVVFFPFLRRLVALSKATNATSIADFIATRFGKSSMLAAVVTGVAVIGLVPYISLQLQAVAMSFEAIHGRVAAESAAWQDLAFYAALIMAVFAMLFGTRRAAATEHNRGLVLAMGFESLLKLTAMLALGGFVLFVLFSGPAEFAERAPSPEFSNLDSFLTLTLLGALAMFTLPHQFHIGVVECRQERHLRVARWLFPLFLILISLPILPLARAGNALLEGVVTPDLYVLMLPLGEGQNGLALLAFLGGLSAATSMVILASLTLSIMIGNHWLTPALLNRHWGRVSELGIPVRQQRRLGIVVVLLLAYVYSRSIGVADALADIGALSFSGLAQLGPAVILAVYRPGLSARAILAGIVFGVAAWAYVLFLPLLLTGFGVQGDWMSAGPLGLTWLAPENLFGMAGFSPLTRAVVASLAVNLMVTLIGVRLDAAPGRDTAEDDPMRPDMLYRLAERFLPEEQLATLFAERSDARSLAARLEHELAAVVGSASARLLLDAARRRTPAPLDTVADLVGQAAEQARFSREVLSGALENMSQGVCVVDQDMRLVAWNSAYLALFDYPEELIRLGRPVADLLRHNAESGLMGGGDIERKIQRRIAHKRAGTRHRIERPWPDGRIIEIRGNPMPGGGFVATFTDVTAFRNAEEELRRINETLEQRVADRTHELEQAKVDAERASEAKTRFLAAVSHDLVQPLNAAQLLTHALSGRVNDERSRKSLDQISGALGATEDLIEGLLDISRLDAGGMEPRRSRFPLGELFSQLQGEFTVLARERGLRLECVDTRVWVETDPQLLRRILQNFLSNAVRYTRHGRVLIGCRRRGDQVLIGIWDTGPGITTDDQAVIFEEFRRLGDRQHAPGLGLGLAIAERMARLLGHDIELISEPGRGTVFGVQVPRAEPVQSAPSRSADRSEPGTGRVLIVDNEAAMLGSLDTLVSGWGFEVRVASNAEQALAAVGQFDPELLVVDYHLDEGHTGLELLDSLRETGCDSPAILISADHAAEVRQAARRAGGEFLHKPIRPLALRSLITRMMPRRRRGG
ncbi:MULTISPECIES: PAS-domain containing protein [unclassified Wenzhouxiangella]|uniref:hybrid sensor histidine kinase/response regulator n=1 Tax=unclassified Wenzhouxiangella TaxID=2613841 RepID=UPI000E327FF1|nr:MULTISPECIES: PAS-domain containing protein [unclassified Wenzhouxiangella]RFF28760.1 response regulator [Wenzhouxiangella sp. 15181]RFP67836.1 response regulator [Wenzhouxiangella sp. 15190]